MQKTNPNPNPNPKPKNDAVWLQSLINNPFGSSSTRGYHTDKTTEKNAVRLVANENLAFPRATLHKILAEIADGIDIRLYPEEYSESLCKSLAEKHRLLPENILVANGGDTIIDLVVRMTISPTTRAVIVNPTFSMYEHATIANYGTVNSLELTLENNQFSLVPEKILKNCTKDRDRLLFLCSPNNPTGNQFKEEHLLQLVQEFPGIVALDETYAEFGTHSLIDRLEEFPNLVVIKSFSKLYGLAGLRVGYLVGNETLIARAKEILPAYNVNSFAIETAKVLLSQKYQRLLRTILQTVIQERERMYSRLSKVRNITPFPSQTNFILFRVFGQQAAVLQKNLLRKGFFIRNMSAYPLCENCLRMTVTTKENNKRFVDALEQELQEKE